MLDSWIVFVGILPLLATVTNARPQGTDQCPNVGICPDPKPEPSQCLIPETDFPGLNIDALRAQDTVTAGNVEIINCGSQADTVKQWLAQTQQLAQAAASSCGLGVRSPYGYQAIFKNQSSVAKVEGVFRRIADIIPPYSSGCLANRYPALLCVDFTADANIPQSLVDYCATSVTAVVSTDNPWIAMICPKLHSYPTIDSRYVRCPGLANNQAVPNDNSFSLTPSTIILEEFAHMYLGLDENHPEKYNIQDLISMNAAQSVENGPSYAAYAAAVYKKCTRWPLV